MGLEFLARVRRSTLVLAAIAAIVTTVYAGGRAGLAVAAGAAWSLVNLFLLERLVVAITSPGRGSLPALRRAAFAAGGMMALFGAGGALLFLLPPVVLLAGFLIPLAIIVLKAASTLVLGSRAWARLISSPWRATVVVVTLLLAAWWLVPTRLMTPAQGQAEHATTTVQHESAGASAGAAPVAEGHAETAHGEAHEASQGPEKFANFVVILTRLFPNAPWSHELHHYEPIVFSLLVGLILVLVGIAASRAPKLIPGRLQAAAELAVQSLYDFIAGILGPEHGRRFFPFLATLFIYIFAMNLFGILPFMDSPSSNLNVTFALGLTVFVYAQYVGIRSLGPIGYIDHMMGSPRNLTGWILAPIMLPIHVLGELAKPISLSCRLFGNIFGEDMLMVAFATLGVGMLSATHLPFGIPMHAIFYPLALLTSALQALVFTVLSTIYILLMLPHDEHHAEEHHEHAALAPAPVTPGGHS
jgi:F-type H+-transporting ATPase subunit a